MPDPSARPSDGHPNALDFLPPGIAAKPLYTFLGPLIDYALTPGSGVNDAVLDGLVGELSLTYTDVEAVNAYVNLFLRPVVGTRSVMDYAFQLLGVSPHLVEWFQPRPQEPGETVAPTGPSDKSYRFGVTFDMDTLPKGPFEYGALIRLLLVLKNERSRLMSVRMIDCVDELTLDNDCEVDKYWLDSIEGFVDPASGVTICLHDNFAQEVTEQTHTTVVARTSRLAETTLGFQFGMLDFTALDTDTVFDCGSWTPNQARTWDWVRREIYCPQSLDFATGAMLYFQGRTSDRAISVTGDQPAPHPVRTWIFDQAITVSLSPGLSQTLSVRLDTQAIPRAAMYSQPSWSDRPDMALSSSPSSGTWGTQVLFSLSVFPNFQPRQNALGAAAGQALSWSDQQPRSWLGEQPQAYQTHSQQIQSGYFFASASPGLGGLAASGIGKHGVSGKAAATQPRPIVVVVDNVAPAGPARASLPRPAAHASGVTGPSARGVLTVRRPVVAGVAERVPIGAAFVFLPRPLANATG